MTALNKFSGMLWRGVAIFLLTLNDSLYKLFSLQLLPERVVLWRSLMVDVLLGIYLVAKKQRFPAPARPGLYHLHLIRGGFAFLSPSRCLILLSCSFGLRASVTQVIRVSMAKIRGNN